MSIKKWLQNWLEIDEADKDLEKKQRELISDLKYWKQTFKKQQPTKKCTKCKQPIDLFPFNDNGSYYIKGNRVTHQACPTPTKSGVLENSDD